MDRKECYRLTHPLSKISGYATATYCFVLMYTCRFTVVINLNEYVMIRCLAKARPWKYPASEQFLNGTSVHRWLLRTTRNTSSTLRRTSLILKLHFAHIFLYFFISTTIILTFSSDIHETSNITWVSSFKIN